MWGALGLLISPFATHSPLSALHDHYIACFDGRFDASDQATPWMGGGIYLVLER